MIDPALYLAFVATTTVLILIPGPNVALIVANSVAYGLRYGLLTVAGTSSAIVAQLTVASLGVTQLLKVLADGFEWIRWIGAAYLIYLGVHHWCAPAFDLTKIAPEPKSAHGIYTRALFVSLTNPKLLVFYGALFPQFISTEKSFGVQVAVLSATFVVLAVLLDGTWALIAGRARKLFATNGRLRNRLTGGVLVAAGTALGLARD